MNLSNGPSPPKTGLSEFVKEKVRKKTPSLSTTNANLITWQARALQ